MTPMQSMRHAIHRSMGRRTIPTRTGMDFPVSSSAETHNRSAGQVCILILFFVEWWWTGRGLLCKARRQQRKYWRVSPLKQGESVDKHKTLSRRIMNTAQQPPVKRPRTSTDSLVSDVSPKTVYDPSTNTCCLAVHSMEPVQSRVSLRVDLSVPAPDEECVITLEPISEYSLPFLPGTTGVLKNHPEQTKASLPCGHGFSAQALLYHLATNSMTCPCCRAGHVGERMATQSVPLHLRRPFSKHLEKVRSEDAREQVVSDALMAGRMMEHEVSSRFEMTISIPATRMVLSLCAFSSMDRSLAPDPMLALELPLTSSLVMGIMECVSFGYSLRQLNLTLRLLPMRVAGFEIVVGVKSLHYLRWESCALFRTARFESNNENRRVIPSTDGGGGVEVQTITNIIPRGGGEGENTQFSRITWRCPVFQFTELLIRTVNTLSVPGNQVEV